jgi:hypothetical protein
MHHADPTAAGHGDCQASFGDLVHGGRTERHVQRDGRGEVGGSVDNVGQHIAETRDQDDIVEGQAFETGELLGVVAGGGGVRGRHSPW